MYYCATSSSTIATVVFLIGKNVNNQAEYFAPICWHPGCFLRGPAGQKPYNAGALARLGTGQARLKFGEGIHLEYPMKKTFVNSRGQVAVLYAGIAAILIGAIALGSDVAVMYVNWQQMQKTADAAAIAGANYLAGYTFTGTPASGCTGEPQPATTRSTME
jgi:hypothetical protein